MDREAIAKAIGVLEHVRGRSALFLYELSEQAAHQWLSGFESACYAFGLPLSLEVRREATYKRGWGFPAAGPTGEMRERGYTDKCCSRRRTARHVTPVRRTVGAERLPEGSFSARNSRKAYGSYLEHLRRHGTTSS